MIIAVVGGVAVPLEHIRERWGLPVMPSGLRAPEVTLGSIWGQAIDIWALGALVRCLIQRDTMSDTPELILVSNSLRDTGKRSLT